MTSQFLYAAAFSGGTIKVGRSNKPLIRIAQHEERCAVVGIELLSRHIVECVGDVRLAENELIARCFAGASSRRGNEWFGGLVFSDVCAWIDEAATAVRLAPTVDIWGLDGMDPIRELIAAGWTQAQIARGAKCSQPTVSALLAARAGGRGPSFSVAMAILTLHKEVCGEKNPPAHHPVPRAAAEA